VLQLVAILSMASSKATCSRIGALSAAGNWGSVT
jgi:hypothetical protein